MQLNSALVTGLARLGITSLTPVQTTAIPAILARKNVVLHSETGSGKTLAYLCPLIQRLSDAPSTRSLVLAPTNDLCSQIRRVLGDLGRSISDFSMSSNAIAVETPHYLYAKRQFAWSEPFEAIVLDEADALLTGDRSRLLRDFLQRQRNFASPQFVFAAATFSNKGTKSVDSWVRSFLKNVEFVRSPATHRSLSSLMFETRHVADEPAKLRELKTILSSAVTFNRVLVFCRTVASAQKLAEELELARVPHARFDKSIPFDQRTERLTEFSDGTRRVLVATNLAARGIDIPSVDLVVQFDYANNVTEFLHRAGRAGRLGTAGKVISFVLPPEEPLARLIKGHEDLGVLFSRNRSLRNAIKKGVVQTTMS